MPVTIPTVLVLGAGASQPYGFPLGVDLRDAVCDGLARGTCRRILLDIGHSEAKIDRLNEELQHSAYRSVDLFLEHNPQFLLIGKRAIAAVLLPCEKEARLFPPGASTGAHWYEHLTEHLEPATVRWGSNCVSIVTFNYDRSLEHYLTRVVAQRARCSLDDAVTLRQHVPIVHVHGSIGQYSPSPFTGLPYGTDPTASAVANAAQSIRVVSDVYDASTAFARAAALLAQAKRIYFMGFGFLPANVKRLKVFTEPPWPKGRAPLIAGTRKGLADREWASARTLFGRLWNGHAVEADPLDFLRGFADLT